ncbi:alpha,alpha-trehalose-phosphate synthase (UDP-forming) [Herpetosiphon giganteus]|uniref:alpha,alpha-trehalose-phosphate synthase (UDP-forming) n=1 Tax=Herpetosiphon giganteus TaxID=2029754 RepID=UPI001958D4EB|nr:trehalose-6-phosphate synthase [Herpetosiphon giganteus]MBM7844457.1 trehalose 6-phosphate synthase [Herpetosiphon giganteus]
MQELPNRLMIVSNRLPITIAEQPNGTPMLKPASGGLVTALDPILRQARGTWIGWSGTNDADQTVDQLLEDATNSIGYHMHAIHLSQEEQEKFYLGFSNEIIWPLFHDLQSRCNFDPSYWTTYEQVNRKYAETIAEHYRDDTYIWVQDYQLINVACELRQLGIDAHIGFFLHIPFPHIDIFLKLPWREQILNGLLEYDLLGFQTNRDLNNFLICVEALLPDAEIDRSGEYPLILHADRNPTKVGFFPISIDPHEFRAAAHTQDVDSLYGQIRESFPARKLILGVDRLDYTKGIPERLQAFSTLLETYPELQQAISLTQVVVPSREDISEYADLKQTIQQLVSEINGKYTKIGWVPIHYIYRSLPREELLAYYRAAHAALITPLKDGMNLVAKEYAVCGPDDGVLILSEFAGAAMQLSEHSLTVNPYDLTGTAQAIYNAVTMPRAERMEHISKLRHSINQYDIYWWVDTFLQAANVKRSESVEQASGLEAR